MLTFGTTGARISLVQHEIDLDVLWRSKTFGYKFPLFLYFIDSDDSGNPDVPSGLYRGVDFPQFSESQ